MALIQESKLVVSEVVKWSGFGNIETGFAFEGDQKVLMDVARDVGAVVVWDAGNTRWRSPADADISTGALVAGTKLGVVLDDRVQDVTIGASVEVDAVVAQRGDFEMVASKLSFPAAGITAPNVAIVKAALADNAGLRVKLI